MFLKRTMDIGMCWGPVSSTAKISDFPVLNYKSTSTLKDMKLQAAIYFFF